MMTRNHSLLIALILTVFISVSHASVKLRQVHVITRHGDRTPVHDVPTLQPVTWICALANDIFVSPLQSVVEPQSTNNQVFVKLIKSHTDGVLPGNCTLGQLTQRGMLQHYNLGQAFYKKYTALQLFKQGRLIQDQVYVESTDVQRTIQSAESQLLGLIPSDQRRPSLPIHVMAETSCDLYPNYALCPKLNLIRKQVIASHDYKEFEKKYQPLKDQIISLLGAFPDWVTLYDVFFCRECHNYTLPTGWNTNIVNQIYNAAAEEYNLLLSDKEFLRLGMGPFLHRLLNEMKQQMTPEENETKFVLHSGHDTSIGPLIKILGISDGSWPPYASNLVFELYQMSADQDDFALKILYNGIDETQRMFMTEYVKWTVFKGALEGFIPRDFNAECSL